MVDLSADEIWVRIDGDDEDYKLKKKKILGTEKIFSRCRKKHRRRSVLGSFEQYPIRLAGGDDS